MSGPERYTGWRKSSYSGTGNNCVEAGRAFGRSDVGVRDSALVAGGAVLEFSVGEWGAFMVAIKEGRYRLP
ncbi:DUF397 domain-containing protein [Actinomadura sp. 7K507]|uniref:DUF397 domain-containing protein n=1 Tax=Actinomadura sp. 7K507 TaxID=2530365 RepID=UPI0010447AEE|nr:DUF397 domain-containing protein [Actinomadura sp. 7K507]TDC91990.1 DUF397 domain-containing protein [Actinomadura sp. 7K507]